MDGNEKGSGPEKKVVESPFGCIYSIWKMFKTRILMSIDEKFYSLNPKDIDREDFFKNLPILFEEGFLIFVNPSLYLKQVLEPFFVQNLSLHEELKKYQLDTSDTIIKIRYNQKIQKLFLKINSFSFEHFFFLLEGNEYVISWVGAGKYTTICLSLDFVDDNKMRTFCKSLCINNYCTQLFPFKMA
jgi:hypothetical protein